jgi:hypothetical protein
VQVRQMLAKYTEDLLKQLLDENTQDWDPTAKDARADAMEDRFACLQL